MTPSPQSFSVSDFLVFLVLQASPYLEATPDRRRERRPRRRKASSRDGGDLTDADKVETARLGSGHSPGERFEQIPFDSRAVERANPYLASRRLRKRMHCHAVVASRCTPAAVWLLSVGHSCRKHSTLRRAEPAGSILNNWIVQFWHFLVLLADRVAANLAPLVPGGLCLARWWGHPSAILRAARLRRPSVGVLDCGCCRRCVRSRRCQCHRIATVWAPSSVPWKAGATRLVQNIEHVAALPPQEVQSARPLAVHVYQRRRIRSLHHALLSSPPHTISTRTAPPPPPGPVSLSSPLLSALPQPREPSRVCRARFRRRGGAAGSRAAGPRHRRRRSVRDGPPENCRRVRRGDAFGAGAGPRCIRGVQRQARAPNQRQQYRSIAQRLLSPCVCVISEQCPLSMHRTSNRCPDLCL